MILGSYPENVILPALFLKLLSFFAYIRDQCRLTVCDRWHESIATPRSDRVSSSHYSFILAGANCDRVARVPVT